MVGGKDALDAAGGKDALDRFRTNDTGATVAFFLFASSQNTGTECLCLCEKGPISV